MKKNFYIPILIIFTAMFCISGVINFMLEETTSRCIKEGCKNKQASGSSYCYVHKPYKSSYSISYSSSSPAPYKTPAATPYSSSSSRKSAAPSASSSTAVTKKSYSAKSSKSSSSRSKSYKSYDEGYESVYDDDDYDLGRYNRDRDYADGVDDALDDLEDEED